MTYEDQQRQKTRDEQFVIQQMLKDKQIEMGGLTGLINASQNNPEAAQAALSRYGINAPVGQSRRQAALQQAMQLAAFKAAIGGKKGGGGLPPDLVGAIGTPDFGQRLKDAVAGGSIDRESLQTLYGLDQRERQFQAKGVAKPGKLSPYGQKLQEMEALGIPITMDTVREIYKSPAPKDNTPNAFMRFFGADTPPPPATLSPSAVFRQAAGLAGGQEQPADVAAPEDRMNQLESQLFGN